MTKSKDDKMFSFQKLLMDRIKKSRPEDKILLCSTPSGRTNPLLQAMWDKAKDRDESKVILCSPNMKTKDSGKNFSYQILDELSVQDFEDIQRGKHHKYSMGYTVKDESGSPLTKEVLEEGRTSLIANGSKSGYEGLPIISKEDRCRLQLDAQTMGVIRDSIAIDTSKKKNEMKK